MMEMDIEEQQLPTVYQSRTEKKKELTKFYTEFGLREIFKDNHNTDNLYSMSFCPDPRPDIVAITASNHLSVLGIEYRTQWVGLQLKFVNGSIPLTRGSLDQKHMEKESEILSFSWLAHQPFGALAGTRGGEVKRFQLQQNTRELKPFADKHSDQVTSIAGFYEGKYAVSLSKNNGEVRVWDCGNPDSCLHRELVNSAVLVTVSFDDQSVLIGCKSSLRAVTLKMLDDGCVAAGSEIILDMHKGKTGNLQICKSLSSDEVVIVFGWSITVWNLKSKLRVAIWQSSVRTNSAGSFDVCRTSSVCVLGCLHGAIEIRDVYSGLLYKRLEHRRIENMPLTHVAISIRGENIIAGNGAKIYKISKKYNQSPSALEFSEE